MKLIVVVFISYIFALYCLMSQVDAQEVVKVYYNSNDPPKPGQKSLIIIFDGTVSMTEDLEQLRIAARDIINDFSNRKENSIYNYILVVFRDLDNEDAINTRNPKDIIDLLDKIVLDSSNNMDCPELAISGLNAGLKYALPYSYAYVFTDATAKDYHLANVTQQLIQSTQTTVNFLTTGNCNEPSHVGYKVYGEIAGTQGQVFNVPRNEISKVISNLKVQLDQKFANMKSINVGKAGKRKIPFFVDSTMSDIRISLSGSSPKMIIQDPNSEYVTVKDLILSDMEFVHIENPLPGKWTLTATSSSDFSVRMGAISTVRFDFGFSLQNPLKASETLFQPLKGQKNILSIFISNPELLKSLTSVTLISNENNGNSSRKRREITENTLELTKITDNIYVTQAFDIPDELFSIQLDGTDFSGNQIERLISSSVRAITPNEPEILNEVNHYEFEEHKPALITCKVKSQIPLTLHWFHGYTKIDEMHSKQSSEFELNISRVLLSDAGNYTCRASNDIGEDESEIITVDILAATGICSSLKFSSIIDGCFWIRNKISS